MNIPDCHLYLTITRFIGICLHKRPYILSLFSRWGLGVGAVTRPHTTRGMHGTVDGDPQPATWKVRDRLVAGSGAAQPGIVWANLVVCGACVVAASGPGWSESRRSH